MERSQPQPGDEGSLRDDKDTVSVDERVGQVASMRHPGAGDASTSEGARPARVPRDTVGAPWERPVAGRGPGTIVDDGRDDIRSVGPESESRGSLEGPVPTSGIPTNEATSGQSGSRSQRRLALGAGSLIPGTPYRVRRWLGDGGMGVVFEAEHVDIERRVAVKVLHSRSVRSKWVTQAFRTEARTSARIGSPNIVEILDFKELEDGRLLIAMEFLDGITLRMATEDVPLAGPRLVGIARQICKGLHAAHQAGVVHRDIKPENIMLVEREGRRDFVKLVDFGVAQILRDDSTNRVVGTAQYMAPESSRAQGDARSDIYSVGCLLYELACGEAVFDGDEPLDIMLRQRSEFPPLPSLQAPAQKIPPGFDALVMQCMRKDPNARYQTMAEVEAALCELQIEQGWVTDWDDLDAPDVGPERRAEIEAGYQTLRGRSRWRLSWSQWSLVGMGLICLLMLAIWPWGGDEAEENQEVDTLTVSARAAAARFYFIYPPHGDPQGPTAYRTVLSLEALEREPAVERASALRQEFATTLVRLGDRYWGFEEARPFAHEYYAAALMFTDDEHARARIDVSVVALERLRAKAALGDFTEHELLASEALAALADSNPVKRQERLAELQDSPISVTMAQSIDRVLEQEKRRNPIAKAVGLSKPAPEAAPEPAPEAAPDLAPEAAPDPAPEAAPDPVPEAAPEAEPEDAGTSSNEDARPVPPSAPRNRAQAKALVVQAKEARRDRNDDKAETLFHRALAADRRNVAALDGLGAIAFSQSRYIESVKHYERAVRLGLHSAPRWISLGDAYFKTLHYDDALRAYERAEELGSSVAAGRVAKVERKLGRGPAPSE